MRQKAAAQAQVMAQAKEKMQQQFVQEVTQKAAQTAKRSAKGLERIRNAVIRNGQAAARAAVGLPGGAGALIARF